MFTMKDYPRDILPLYAQGFSVAKYLIMEKGRRHFLDYVNAAMELERPGRELDAWNRVTKQYYGYEDLSDLQVRGERWVAEGSQEKEIPSNQDRVASFNENQKAAGQSIRRQASNTVKPPADPFGEREPRRVLSASSPADSSLKSMNEGWYARQMKVGRSQLDPQEQSRSAKTQQSDTFWR